MLFIVISYSERECIRYSFRSEIILVKRFSVEYIIIQLHCQEEYVYCMTYTGHCIIYTLSQLCERLEISYVASFSSVLTIRPSQFPRVWGMIGTLYTILHTSHYGMI